MKHPMQTLPPRVFVLLALLALGWGVNWPVMKIVLTEMPPLHFRSVCLLIGFCGLFLVARMNALPIRVPAAQWPRMLVISLFNMAGWHVLAVYGIPLMEAGRAAILGYTFPVWSVMLSAWLLHEKITPRKMFGLATGIAAMLLLLGTDVKAVGRSPTGALMLIGAAISWSIGLIAMKRWPVSLPTSSFTAWQMLIVFVPITIAAQLFEAGSFSITALSPPAFWGVVYNGLVGFIFCNWAFMKIATIAPVSVSSLSILLVPVVGVFSSMLMLGERLHWTDLTALVLVLASLATVLIPVRAGRVPA
jgi:drug/metabolite transporter (DMT)-like permease